MRGRAFWFLLGVGATAFTVVKGQQYYRRLTPAGVQEQLQGKATDAREWLTDFATTYAGARDAKESELMAMLTNTERGQLE